MGDDYGDYAGYDYSGDPAGATAVGLPPGVDPNYYLPGDIYDAQAMAPWTPPAAQAQDMTWWQGLMAYGITKAIDNQFPNTPTGIYGNTYPGSIAGPGRTYTLNPLANGGGAASAGARFSLAGNPLLMLALVGVAVLLLKK